MATSLTFLSALSACAAAPVPLPPQPTSPTRRVDRSWACVLRLFKANGATTAAVPVAFRNSRREIGDWVEGLLIGFCGIGRILEEAANVSNGDSWEYFHWASAGRVGVIG